MDRIAQLICEKFSYPAVEKVKTLENTDRGAEGLVRQVPLKIYFFYRNMSLTTEYRNIASGHVVQLHTLKQNPPYPVYAKRLINQ